MFQGGHSLGYLWVSWMVETFMRAELKSGERCALHKFSSPSCSSRGIKLLGPFLTEVCLTFKKKISWQRDCITARGSELLVLILADRNFF